LKVLFDVLQRFLSFHSDTLAELAETRITFFPTATTRISSFLKRGSLEEEVSSQSTSFTFPPLTSECEELAPKSNREVLEICRGAVGKEESRIEIG